MPSKPKDYSVYELRRGIQDAVRRSRGLPLQDRYYPPSNPPEGTREGGEWIMDADTDCEGPAHAKPKWPEMTTYEL